MTTSRAKGQLNSKYFHAGAKISLNTLKIHSSSDRTLVASSGVTIPWQDFKLQIIVNQFGVDSHVDDPLAHHSSTMKVYEEPIPTLHRLAHEVCRERYTVTDGGGYKPENVVIAWAIVFSMISQVTIPDQTPETWISFCRGC